MKKLRSFISLRRHLRNSDVREQITRILSITSLIVAVGTCVVLVLAFVLKMEVLLVAFSGIFAVALASYLFIRLWPREMPAEMNAGEAVARALKKREAEPLGPEEYRKQREMAQKLIKDKAAPMLARAIRGILKQDEMAQRRKR